MSKVKKKILEKQQKLHKTSQREEYEKKRSLEIDNQCRNGILKAFGSNLEQVTIHINKKLRTLERLLKFVNVSDILDYKLKNIDYESNSVIYEMSLVSDREIHIKYYRIENGVMKYVKQ